jgi:hypothetical protein
MKSLFKGYGREKRLGTAGLGETFPYALGRYWVEPSARLDAVEKRNNLSLTGTELPPPCPQTLVPLRYTVLPPDWTGLLL